ncbi:uncharacterized protein [Hetaerina americana]|uniref:uncharacterized protein n=1 Tax=Hetaerina americana TaxID=62018 RepID=UPI003A7F2999
MHLSPSAIVFLTLSLTTQCLGSYLPESILAEFALKPLPNLQDGCSIAITGGLPKHQPLILNTDNPPTVALPNGNGSLEVPKDGVLRLACSGASNNLSVTETPEAFVTCVSGTTFRVKTPEGSDEEVDFEKLTCTEYPYSTARYREDEDPDCQPPNSPTEIGFILPSDGYFLRVIDGCFNNRSLNSVYTHFEMPSVISSFENNFPRPGFKQSYFYGNLSVNTIFTRNNQRATVSKILGSDELGLKYIQSDGDHYLARGHFSAKADFIYGAIQRATFYFINAAPQWQSFNGANWVSLETNLRDFAASSKLNLSVWTGSYGVTTLPDVNGVEQKISLYIDENGNQQIDVPALYWKVALDRNTGGCSIAITSGLPEHQPLILNTDNPPTVALPNGNGSLEVPKGGVLRLACCGASNDLSVTETPEAFVTCVSGTTFRVKTPEGSDEEVDFEKLTCTEYPYSTARYREDEDPDCQPPNSPTEIGFILPSDGYFLRVIDGCFNNRSLNSVYTHFEMPSVISSFENNFPRPGFKQSYFYGNLSVNTIFTRNNQRATVSKILGSDELGLKYIQSDGDHYLARGHFSAKADFIYGAIQRATFYFINAAPQWQSFNGANWVSLETNLRDFAASSKLNLSVWTGSYGVTTLPDVNGVEQKISLYIDENGNQQIDVPALYWKVALDRNTGQSAAFVGVNNPYLDPVPESMILCSSRLKENGTNNGNGCSIHINGGLPEYQPLILLTESPPVTALPKGNGVLEIPENGNLRLACPGISNSLAHAETPEAIVTCASGTLFRVMTPTGSAAEVDFVNLTCAQHPYSTARYRTDPDPTCRTPNSALEIGFLRPGDGYFLRIIDGCFNNRSLNAIYTHFEMPHSISAFQKGIQRRRYTKGKFYGNLPVNALYSRKKQRETISKILDSEELGLKYVPEAGDVFLARGHLTAKGDFIYGSHQRVTFFFVNAAPQWHTFNAGNWASLEVSLRDFASTSQTDLSVWTGTHGVSSLPDANGLDTRLSLHLDDNGNGQIEVPAVYWKVALDRRSGRAAAFVGVNNPHLASVPEDLVFCESVCESIRWLKWRSTDIIKGYSYCCEVEELRKVVKNIPEFETTGLLVLIFFSGLVLLSSAGEKSLGNSSALSVVDVYCRLNAKEDFPDPLPLILTIEDNPRFVLPDVDGVLRFPTGRGIRLVCAGPGNVLPIIGYPDANVECIIDKRFTVPTTNGYRQADFVELKCANPVKNTARYKGDEDLNCPSPLLPFEVGFTLPKDEKFVQLYDGCFNGRKFNTVYSRFIMSPSSRSLEGGFPFVGSLSTAGFYGDLDLNSLYSVDSQRKVISELLGSSELGSKYINNKEGRFLSPGLLTTDGDFEYSSQKNSTYYFVNSFPQWQYVDSKNWNDLDISLRDFAVTYNHELSVWSGTYGVMTLPDSNGTHKKLSIFINENGLGLIDVPALLWRVALDPNTGYAVAFASINNPYLTVIPDSLILCDSVCDKLEWLRWSPEVINGSYSYCCEVDQLRKTITSIPDLEINGLLGSTLVTKAKT